MIGKKNIECGFLYPVLTPALVPSTEIVAAVGFRGQPVDTWPPSDAHMAVI